MKKPTKQPAADVSELEASQDGETPIVEAPEADTGMSAAADPDQQPESGDGPAGPAPDDGTPDAAEAAASEAEDEDAGLIEMPEVVDLPRAGDLYERFEALRDRPVVIDASAVKFIGTPALQVLLAAAASWRLAGVEFELRSPSKGFLACTSRLGLPADILMQGDPA